MVLRVQYKRGVVLPVTRSSSVLPLVAVVGLAIGAAKDAGELVVADEGASWGAARRRAVTGKWAGVMSTTRVYSELRTPRSPLP